MLDSLATWLTQNTGTVAVIGLLSFLLLSLSLLATPWVLAKLPADYFAAPQITAQLSLGRFLASLAKTLLGIVMIFTGLVMMFTPGPGLVCLILGLVLCEFPGKHRLLQQLVRRPAVFSTLNWLRSKADKSPFILPPKTH